MSCVSIYHSIGNASAPSAKKRKLSEPAQKSHLLEAQATGMTLHLVPDQNYNHVIFSLALSSSSQMILQSDCFEATEQPCKSI